MQTARLIADCRLVAVVAAVLSVACGSGYTAVEKPSAHEWKRVGSWSGRGDRQTESFTSDTGSLRVRWQTKDEVPPVDGTFRLTLHSAISGRPLVQAVEQRGVGADTSYVSEDPRVFYVVVDSARVEWSFTIDEGIGARTIGASEP